MEFCTNVPKRGKKKEEERTELKHNTSYTSWAGGGGKGEITIVLDNDLVLVHTSFGRGLIFVGIFLVHV